MIYEIQVSEDASTLWVHASDGSTVGRFSKRFGMDVHTTVSQQLEGAQQCLHCTHVPASEADWDEFRMLMGKHYGVTISRTLLSS